MYKVSVIYLYVYIEQCGHTRHKEEANDYRYFPEPDLQPIIITEKYIANLKQKLPPLPNTLFLKFTKEFGRIFRVVFIL